jgi:large subunit ribosomal protein L9
MQVILLEKIANLGALGEVVKVKAGFARNYLIPKGKAQRATPENLAHFETRRGELEAAQSEALRASQDRATKLEGAAIQLTRRASVDGRLFGSVTAYDIVEALAEIGHEIERSAIRMPQGPLKMIGDHDVAVALHSDVVVHIKVAVLGEAVADGVSD